MVARARTSGFTLIELLVALAVIAFIIAIVPPLFDKGLGGVSLKAAARGIAGTLRQARSEAITRNREVTFTIDVEGRRYGIGNRTGGTVPADAKISLFTAQSERIDATTGNIRFFPNGGSTGGRVSLSDDQRQYHVSIDWLTGQVSVAE